VVRAGKIGLKASATFSEGSNDFLPAREMGGFRRKIGGVSPSPRRLFVPVVREDSLNVGTHSSSHKFRVLAIIGSPTVDPAHQCVCRVSWEVLHQRRCTHYSKFSCLSLVTKLFIMCHRSRHCRPRAQSATTTMNGDCASVLARRSARSRSRPTR